jgi:hypothetical protein
MEQLFEFIYITGTDLIFSLLQYQFCIHDSYDRLVPEVSTNIQVNVRLRRITGMKENTTPRLEMRASKVAAIQPRVSAPL